MGHAGIRQAVPRDSELVMGSAHDRGPEVQLLCAGARLGRAILRDFELMMGSEIHLQTKVLRCTG